MADDLQNLALAVEKLGKVADRITYPKNPSENDPYLKPDEDGKTPRDEAIDRYLYELMDFIDGWLMDRT